MRTQLELWQVVKDNFDEYFCSGLCLLISDLELYDIIDSEEKESLKKELSEYGNPDCFFLGDEEDPKPRLKFIEKMIKKHSQ